MSQFALYALYTIGISCTCGMSPAALDKDVSTISSIITINIQSTDNLAEG